MSNFIDRLDQEFAELSEKSLKLERFLYTVEWRNLSKEHQTLLEIQYQAMETYRLCLQRRIDLINKKD